MTLVFNDGSGKISAGLFQKFKIAINCIHMKTHTCMQYRFMHFKISDVVESAFAQITLEWIQLLESV